MGTFLAGNPLAIFALLLVLSVVVPPLVRPLRLPDLVGLLLAGVAIGPHGLAWLVSSNETVRLLSDVGVIYLLFIAGLEIDLGSSSGSGPVPSALACSPSPCRCWRERCWDSPTATQSSALF